MFGKCEVKFIRVTGYTEGRTETKIVEEVNRGSYEEATEFINSHHHDNISWKIMPLVFKNSGLIL